MTGEERSRKAGADAPVALRAIEDSPLAMLLLFVLMVPIGTLAHEAGHAVVAGELGYDWRVSFAFTSYEATPRVEGEAFGPTQLFLLAAGGPAVTYLCGLVGVCMGWLARRLRGDGSLGIFGWAGAMLALFWSRQVFNLGLALVRLARDGDPGTSDEIELAQLAGLPTWSISAGSAAFGALVCGWVVFRLVPARIRGRFLVTGLLGSALGYVLWFHLLGPAVLP